MPKKIRFESAAHQFLTAVHSSRAEAGGSGWSSFTQSLKVEDDPSVSSGGIRVLWASPKPGEARFSLQDARFYQRAGSVVADDGQLSSGSLEDPIQEMNRQFFKNIASQVIAKAGFNSSAEAPERFAKEEVFHDQWASETDISKIDVIKICEAATSPEIRYIRASIPNLKGKKLLDVGSGLGEVSVYFALQGAQVTAVDISENMLRCTADLAKRYGVTVRTHKTALETLTLPDGELFDVIYAGNIFHHVDIEAALKALKKHLKPDGALVSWDPVAYNPAINVYRKMAMDVRTVDEHPLTLKDIKIFKRHFTDVKTRWFWLTTLSIFIYMALVQKRNPGKERYWKVVVDEADRWKNPYSFLEKIDRGLLTLLPFLKLWCWNVVIISKKPVA